MLPGAPVPPFHAAADVRDGANTIGFQSTRYCQVARPPGLRTRALNGSASSGPSGMISRRSARIASLSNCPNSVVNNARPSATSGTW